MADAHIRVTGGVRGEIPAIWRPSTMFGASTGTQIAKFMAIPGPIGAVRLGKGDLISSADAGTWLARARAYFSDPTVKEVCSRGTGIYEIGGTPRFLSSVPAAAANTPGGVPQYSTAKPQDLTAGGAFATQMGILSNVAMNENGIPSPRNPVTGALEIGRPGILFEWGNEPHTINFWGYTGMNTTIGDYYASWRRLAQGMRDVRSDVAVGGPVVQTYNNVRNDGGLYPGTIIQEFLNYAAANGVPPDFLTWHNFQVTPLTNIPAMTDHVAAALSFAGLSASTPWVLTEYQSNAPVGGIRDGYKGAAYVIAAQEAHRQAGLSAICMASLIKQESPPTPPELFQDGWGQILNSGTYPVSCPNFMIMSLFGLWDEAAWAQTEESGTESIKVYHFASIESDSVATVVIGRWDDGGAAKSVLVDCSGMLPDVQSVRIYKFDSTTNDPTYVFDQALIVQGLPYATAAQMALNLGDNPTYVESSESSVEVTLAANDSAVIQFFLRDAPSAWRRGHLRRRRLH